MSLARQPCQVSFEWDVAKALSNQAKHQTCFEQARLVFDHPGAVRRPDSRFDDGEERWVIIGRCGDPLLSVVFTHRDDNIRPVRARAAGQREARLYHEQ